MRAFNQVPEVQRDRLAALTGERDRLIGGSSDTMYIPGRHREAFMSVLALFLQTNCFLEIAAPTALHLALPPNEEILYVDHVSNNTTNEAKPPNFCFPYWGDGGGFFFLLLRVFYDVTDTFVSFSFLVLSTSTGYGGHLSTRHSYAGSGRRAERSIRSTRSTGARRIGLGVHGSRKQSGLRRCGSCLKTRRFGKASHFPNRRIDKQSAGRILPID